MMEDMYREGQTDLYPKSGAEERRKINDTLENLESLI
jgi:hypothetical protein